MCALVAAVAYLVLDKYYSSGYAQDGRLLPHLLDRAKLRSLAGRIGLLLLGVCLPLLVSRALLGFPTTEWFQTTLIDIPRTQ